MRKRIGSILITMVATAVFSFAEMNEATYFLSEKGVIGSWLSLGPIPDATDAVPVPGHGIDYLGGETSVSPVRGDQAVINEKNYIWKALFDERWFVTLDESFKPDKDRATGYLFCLLESGTDQYLQAEVLGDDTMKLWLDGELIHDQSEPHGIHDITQTIDFSLTKGRHRLLIKVCQNEIYWGVICRLKDRDGNIPKDLRVVLPGTFNEQEYLDNFLSVSAPPLVSKDGKQLLRIKFSNMADPNAVESIRIYPQDQPGQKSDIEQEPQNRRIHLPIERSNRERTYIIETVIADHSFSQSVSVKPCRDWRVYLLPGSHVDIGYTNLQNIVLDDHKKYYRQSMDLHNNSVDKGYGKDAQYLWNPEVSWAVKDFMETESDEDKERLVECFKNGSFVLDAQYLNMLTALCGDEELIRNVYFSHLFSQRYGLPEVRSAMITDVPGYTWGHVLALAGSGVKYFEIGPNDSARIGQTTSAMTYHPYYWIGPDGVSKVLLWNTGQGYSNTFNMLRDELGVDRFLQTLAEMEADQDYPYDVAQFRAYLVDNTPPPDHLSDMVHEWNNRYAVPRLILSGAAAPFDDLLAKYADRIPSLKGDFTPYWEDGAGSSAREVAMTRAATLRLQEAEKAWSLASLSGNVAEYPAKAIDHAYDFTLLFDEHTWGAHNSISEPDSEFAQEQWRMKRSFAGNALWNASRLNQSGLTELTSRIRNQKPYAFAVWNLTQWPRTDIAILSEDGVSDELAAAGPWVAVDATGTKTPVTRDGRGYVFLAKDIPAYGYKVYQILPEATAVSNSFTDVNVHDGTFSSDRWDMQIDPKTGVIGSLVYLPKDLQIIDQKSGLGLNQYLHVLGPDGSKSKSANRARLEKGNGLPDWESSIVAQVNGPGIEDLEQQIRLYSFTDRIDFVNTMNKSDIREKEAVRFAFPFAVPEGEFTLEIPLAWMHPEKDQIPGANRLYYTVRRWIDVSNSDFGVTLVTHDAPLVELCQVHLERDQSNYIQLVEMEHLPLLNTHVFSYAMNNYWFTNYKASQGGPAVFRYSLAIHQGPFKPHQATQFADEVTSPLRVLPLAIHLLPDEVALPGTDQSLISIDQPNVLLQTIKRAEDGNGLIIRLRELDGVDTSVCLTFNRFGAIEWTRCDLVERPIENEKGRSNKGTLNVDIGARQIQTYRIILQDPIKETVEKTGWSYLNAN